MDNEFNKTPAYNLKVVVAETGIKPDTLRAWERRYGLPTPHRTKGRHRLYSDYDLATIKWLSGRQAEGMSISHAVDLWRRLKEEGEDPFEVHALDRPDGAAQVVPIDGARIEDLRDAWIEACHNFDEARAERILTQAFAIYPPENVCVQVLMRGIAMIGQQWYKGEATVQQEHFASSLAMRRLHTLVGAAPPPTRRERLIVACPPQEDHAFAPLLLTLLLRYRGWEVIYLGTDVPLDRMEGTLQTVRPDLVILSAQQLHTAASLLEMTDVLASQDVPVAYGGLIFNHVPAIQKRIPGHFLGTRLEETSHVVEKIIMFSPAVPKPAPVDEAYRAALEHFQNKQSQLEVYMWERFSKADIPYEHFVNANMHMARNITSALALGDMNYIGHELVWIKQLLVNYQWPDTILLAYIKVYREAAEHHLNGRGRPVIDWLDLVIDPNR